MCLPMSGYLLASALTLFTVLPGLDFWNLWMFRIVAMACALISILLFCAKAVTHWPWSVRLNLWINTPGLAICTLGILRYVAQMCP